MVEYFTNDFSKEIWATKYKFTTDKTVEDTWLRVAKDLASIEDDQDKWTKKFYSILKNFHFMPGGRITANAGTNRSGLSYINCFTDAFEGEDQDSIEGIYSTLTRQAQILKSEGGYGFCADVMRPRGAHIGGIGNQSPGAVKFLELWDKSSEIITSGSGKERRSGEKNSIRKGAQLVSMSIWHPDIIEFVKAKTEPGRLTKFNMSVLCTDEFMRAVEKDQEWHLIFPDYENCSKEYTKYWNGDLKKWIANQRPVKIYQTLPAIELWEIIMKNTYNRNEPGVLFIDTINRMNNLWWIEHINALNPCGEQPLDRSTCLLGSLNLIHYIDTDKQDWNYKKLKHDIKIAVRLMDNVNDISKVPLQVHEDSLKNKRRIGLGVIGYASSLMMCRIKYGSKKALELTEKLMEFKANTEYQASVALAREKGIFPLFDKDKFLQSNFISQLSEQTQQLINKYGIRNSHLSSIQPTGNSSVYANNISSGLEPIFAQGYFRTVIVHHFPAGLDVPIVDWNSKSFIIDIDKELKSKSPQLSSICHQWNWTKEGDENILISELNNITYKFDRNRGLTKEVLVEDYSIKYLKEQNLWNEKADWAATTNELKLKDHIETVKIFCKWIDAAASKTLNFSNDYPYEDFKQVYMDAWKAGIKGFTTYRAGTMTNVLAIESSSKILERPKTVAADIHHHTVKGLPYIVFVGLVDNKPYEVFANASLNGDIDRKIRRGEIIKVRKNRYKAIIGQDEICPINALNDENEDALVRMISTNLQSNCDLSVLIKRLDKTQGSMVSLIKAISRALKKYIPDGSKEEGVCPDCGSNNLRRESGCIVCTGCGYSACS